VLAVGGQLHKLDRHARRRTAGMGVEHMGRQAAMHVEPIGGRNPLIEAKRGDAEDFGERRLGFLERTQYRAVEIGERSLGVMETHLQLIDRKCFRLG